MEVPGWHSRTIFWLWQEGTSLRTTTGTNTTASGTPMVSDTVSAVSTSRTSRRTSATSRTAYVTASACSPSPTDRNTRASSPRESSTATASSDAPTEPSTRANSKEERLTAVVFSRSATERAADRETKVFESIPLRVLYAGVPFPFVSLRSSLFAWEVGVVGVATCSCYDSTFEYFPLSSKACLVEVLLVHR